MQVKNYQELNMMELDTLREIGSIGTGNAATALSSILGCTVRIETPEVRIMGYNEAMDWIGGPEVVTAGVLARVEGEIQRLQAAPQSPAPDSLAEAARSHREAAARQSQLGTLAVQRAQLTELLTQAETVLAERAVRARGIAQARKAAYRAGASRRLRRPVSLVEGPLPQQWLPLHRREDTEKGVL